MRIPSQFKGKKKKKEKKKEKKGSPVTLPALPVLGRQGGAQGPRAEATRGHVHGLPRQSSRVALLLPSTQACGWVAALLLSPRT